MELKEIKVALPPLWQWSANGHDYPAPKLLTTWSDGQLGDSLVFEGISFSAGIPIDVACRDLNGGRKGFHLETIRESHMPEGALFMEKPPYRGSMRDWAEARLTLERMESDYDH